MTANRTWLPAAAAAHTILLVWVAAHGPESWSLVAGLSAPLLVPMAWTAVGLLQSPGRPLWSRALLGAGIAIVLAGWPLGLAIAGYVGAGLMVAAAWRWGWRLLTVLVVGAACLAPGFFLGLDGSSVPLVFETWADQLREQHAAGLPPDLSASERAAALEAFEEGLAGTLALQRQLWPSLIAFGLMLQTSLFLALGWLLARVLGAGVTGRPSGSFVTWRAPFASVWCLIGGLILGLAPLGAGRDLGWNLVLCAAVLLAVQGLAVQVWLVRRLLPPFGRTLFWILGVLFFAPVLIGSGGLVGLVDQWWDLRRSRRASGEDQDRT